MSLRLTKYGKSSLDRRKHIPNFWGNAEASLLSSPPLCRSVSRFSDVGSPSGQEAKASNTSSGENLDTDQVAENNNKLPQRKSPIQQHPVNNPRLTSGPERDRNKVIDNAKQN